MDNGRYKLPQLLSYFSILGITGFGGPVALVGKMQTDLVEKRQWISDEEYKQGLALAQLAPGPLAAQLAIYLGYIHYGIIGATLSGLAFVLPSFTMVVLLGMAYQHFGGLPWMQAAFYGMAPAVVSIIFISSIKLTIKTIGKPNIESIKTKWEIWMIFSLSILATVITKQEQISLFIAAGIFYMILKAPPKQFPQKFRSNILLLYAGVWRYTFSDLEKIAFYFAKAGSFVFGSGLAIVPFLHSGVVTENHWLNESQFLDAVAVAMITPGPVVITVGFIGYLVAGLPGAIIASAATFLPCYLFTIILSPYFKKIAKNRSVKAFVEGITSAIAGALFGAVFIIAARTIVDGFGIWIAAITLSILLYYKKAQEPFIIIASAIAGITIKSIL